MSQNRIFPIFLDKEPYEMSAAGSFPLDTSYVYITSGATGTYGLSAGQIAGQCMSVINAAENPKSIAVLSALNTASDVVVLGSTGANALFMWNDSKWVVLSTNGTLS